MSDDCTCTPNDVCYQCYARRRYGQDADRRLEDDSLTVELVPTVGPVSEQLAEERTCHLNALFEGVDER